MEAKEKSARGNEGSLSELGTESKWQPNAGKSEESIIGGELYNEYLGYLLAGDRRQCANLITALLERGIDVADLYLNLFQRSLYRVGELWEFNRITVAMEHQATAITEGLLSLVYPRLFAREHRGPLAVISCIHSEYHQVGGRMVTDLFELNGWNGHFLGANTPIDDLLKFVEDKNPRILGLSLSLYSVLPELLATLEETRRRFPDLCILLGGQALRWGSRDFLQDFKDVTYVASYEELNTLLREQSA